MGNFDNGLKGFIKRLRHITYCLLFPLVFLFLKVAFFFKEKFFKITLKKDYVIAFLIIFPVIFFVFNCKEIKKTNREEIDFTVQETIEQNEQIIKQLKKAGHSL